MHSQAKLFILFILLSFNVMAKLPKSFLGNWSGKCSDVTYTGVQTHFLIEFKLNEMPNSSDYSYILKYGTQGPRDYLLKAIDENAGHYVVDEQNGILIHTFHAANILVSQFQVSGNLIQTKEKFIDSTNMEMEIITFKNQPYYSEGTGFKVLSRPFSRITSCRLKK